MIKTIKRWFVALIEAQEKAGLARAQMILKQHGYKNGRYYGWE
jgi:hypothetical protein